MKKYVNDPDDPKTDAPHPVPRFIYDEVAAHLAKIHSILRRNLTPENKVKAIADTFANASLDRPAASAGTVGGVVGDSD
jgi:hypothetical protein